MTYELRHFDTSLMRFTATEDTSSPEIEILWVNEEKKVLLPLDMNVNGDSVSRWLRHRTIPKNRAYVHNFLSKCGLNLNLTKGGMKAVRDYYESLGEEFIHALDDMLVLDAVICNVDRHFGNFGFMVDNCTNRIIAPAPLFDHGNSLFNLAGRDDISSDKALDNYIDTLVPCVYDDFIGTAKKVLDSRHKIGLRRLLDFRFKRHSRYNLDSKRLKLIEKQIHKRANELLEA
ncbi:MAG: hypothetical protein J6A58_12155 [Oscillospiraceae bacterium]|nr:hypothetical protein [Oscillospiraceae bacterium]